MYIYYERKKRKNGWAGTEGFLKVSFRFLTCFMFPTFWKESIHSTRKYLLSSFKFFWINQFSLFLFSCGEMACRTVFRRWFFGFATVIEAPTFSSYEPFTWLQMHRDAFCITFNWFASCSLICTFELSQWFEFVSRIKRVNCY